MLFIIFRKFLFVYLDVRSGYANIALKNKSKGGNLANFTTELNLNGNNT